MESRLLEHDEFARTLARRLLRDAVRADDVVQDAWLASLQSPPRRGWGMKAWLAGVVRNRARNVVREEARRGNRERKVARAEATDMSAVGEGLSHHENRWWPTTAERGASQSCAALRMIQPAVSAASSTLMSR